MNIANECKNYGIKNIFASGLTVNICVHVNFINAVSNAFKLTCVKYGYVFNIVPDDFWQDSLHINNFGKGKLLNGFLVFSS